MDLKLHFSWRVVNRWNRLPVAAVDAQTIDGFKGAFGNRSDRSDRSGGWS
jgi:hypothetical protein